MAEYFTEREFSVFTYLLLGFTSKMIALKLNLSPRTIEGIVNQIKLKLQCTTKSQIIEAAMRYGLGHP